MPKMTRLTKAGEQLKQLPIGCWRLTISTARRKAAQLLLLILLLLASLCSSGSTGTLTLGAIRSAQTPGYWVSKSPTGKHRLGYVLGTQQEHEQEAEQIMPKSKTIVIRPSYAQPSDTWISDFNDSNNSGHEHVIAGVSSGGNIFRSLLKFDLSNIPATANVTDARIKLFCRTVDDSDAYNIGLHWALTEFHVDYSSDGNYSNWSYRIAPSTIAWDGGSGGGSGDDFAAAATDTVSVQYPYRFYEWDVAGDVQDMVDGTVDDYGWWIINADESTPGSARRFYSSNYTTDIGYGPVLIVEYTESGADGDWYDTDWQYRKEITIDSAQVGSDLTDFPLLVDLSSDTDIEAAAKNNFVDVFFTADDGITRLEHEQAGPPYEIAGGDGAWTFFGSPRAIRHVGSSDKTYVGWITTAGDIQVAAYNHGTEAWEGPTTLKALGDQDDHHAPTLFVRPDGHIMVFYDNASYTELYLRISTNAEDITAFDAEQTLDSQIGAPGYHYATPIQLTDETDDPIYVFFTDAGSGRDLYFSKTEDGGTTWDASTTLFGAGSGWVYFHAVVNGADRIDFTVTNNSPSQGTASIYHFYYEGGNYYTSDGTEIVSSLPLSPSDITEVHDGSANGNSWIWDIAIDGSGAPVVVYDARVDSHADHRYYYGRWNGTSWDTTEIVAGGGIIKGNLSGSYSGGINIDHDDTSTVYLSKPYGGVHNIFKYTTSDNGSTWTEAEQLTKSQSAPHIRPIPVRNGHSDLPLFWLHGRYNDFSDYKMAVLSSRHTSPAKFLVRVPSIPSSVDTMTYVYYGNANAAPQHIDEPVWYGIYD